MKASVYTEYGTLEVAKLKEVPKLVPKGNQVLIKVYASTVNRTDFDFRSTEYFIPHWRKCSAAGSSLGTNNPGSL